MLDLISLVRGQQNGVMEEQKVPKEPQQTDPGKHPIF